MGSCSVLPCFFQRSIGPPGPACSAVLLLLALLTGCRDGSAPEAADTPAEGEKLKVLVSIEPHAYFVERITGDRAEIVVLVPPGKEPVTFTPSPAEMTRVASCHLYFRTHVPIEESLLSKIRTLAPQLKILDTCRAIDMRTMESHAHSGHDHDHDGHHHAHGDPMGKDPHVWLDPQLAVKQTEVMLEALENADAKNASYYRKRHEELVGDLESLDEELQKALAPYEGRSLYVFHPAFGYFCDAYGLKQVAIEIEGKSPKAQQIAEWISRAREEKVRVIFVQPQFDRSAAERIAEAIDGVCLPLDPLARDYVANLKKIAEEVSDAFSEEENDATSSRLHVAAGHSSS
jgi:zinc transport system substrate-binding protein